MACKIDGCSKKVFAAGWCCMHYTRWRKHGSTEIVKRRPNNLLLEELVKWIIESQTKREGECLLWQGAINSSGYGHTSHAGRIVEVHRLICQQYHGDPTEDKNCALHSCDVRNCCSPEHIRWGSNNENVQDRVKRGRGGGIKISGESHYRSKLKERDVREIKMEGFLGTPICDIAKSYGVSWGAIDCILKGKTWKHVN